MLMAASTSHNSTPSSSASTLHPTTNWDVFLSFGGKDTRVSFTDFLYHSLDRNAIRTFRDDPELPSGKVISEALLQAIHESKIYVVVLSENYASSQYCLDELVEILGCSESMDRLVIPVFYYIDPSDVKYQKGSFGEAFLKHESHDTRYEKGRLDRWRHALNQVGKFSGYHVRENMKIACNNSPAPENHSRLWVPEIIHKMLVEKKGTEAIEGIIPSNFGLPGYLRRSPKYSFITASKDKHFTAETFRRMSKLRFLHLDNVNLTGSFEQTFKNLRWLCWESCPLECLPPDFYPEKLVCLALSGSKLRTMWELNTVFENLKTLDMSYSRYLITAPGSARLPCLETLNLEGCERLEEVLILPGSLLRLVSLNLGWCKKLKGLPDNICNLKALKSLNIAGCVNLKAIPVDLGNIESLAELKANFLNVCTLPHSIGLLSKLIELNLSCCKNLNALPDTICNLRSLKILNIDWCRNLEALPKDLGNLESLEELKAQGISVSELPNSIGSLSELVLLELDNCPMLKTLPDTICNLRSLEFLNINWCSSLEALPAELGNLESLVELNARELSNFPKLPASIMRFGWLENLMLSNCFNLLSVDVLPSSLIVLSLHGCKAMERLPNLSNLKQLEQLDLTNCSGLREIQGLEELTSIEQLHLGGCNLRLLKSIFTKRFFQIYSGFGYQITVFAPSSMFPDWINQSPDWIGKTEFPKIRQSTLPHWTSDSGSKMILYLPLNRSHNFLAMILCSKFSRNGTTNSSVATSTNTFGWNSVFETSSFDGNKDFSCMEIVPRKLFSVTDDDSNIIFETRLEFDDGDRESSESPEILGIHLLYKLE